MKSAAAGLCGAAVLPLFLVHGGVAMENLVLASAYVIMALGLNVVVGFAGLLDLGYVAFFAIGAHAAAFFASDFWGIHLDFLLVLAIAGIAAAVAGVVIGIPTLRLRGDYVGVVTLAFGEIVGQVVANRAPQGISAIDRIDVPLLARFGALDLRPWYWFALALVALTLFVSVRLRDSRIGRAWIALREDEGAAASVGVPTVVTKLRAYAVGAAFGGVSGAFLASYLSTVNPNQFTFSFSIFILAMVVVGGPGSVWGVVGGAIFMTALSSYLLPRVLNDLTEISSAIYGFVLVIAMLFRPPRRVAPRSRV